MYYHILRKFFKAIAGWGYSRYAGLQYVVKYYRPDKKIEKRPQTSKNITKKYLSGFVGHKRGRHLNTGKGLK